MSTTSPLTQLAACAGRWKGSNRLHDPFTKAPEDTPSALTIMPVLQGRFLRVDYGWSYQDSPQEGSMVFGADPEGGEVNAHWIDTWHMSQKAMLCSGRAEDGRIVVRGSYACPPGPDWGWQIELRLAPGKALQILMFNISPEGDSSPAVEASYTPDVLPAAEESAAAARRLSEIGQIAITVGDVAKALSFYRDVLGLRFLFSAGPNLAFVAAGPVRIMLTSPEGAGKVGSNSILYFRVENIEVIHAAIVERGAKNERAPQLAAKMPDHDLWIGFLRDPEDNLIGLMEEKKGG
jgi:predicted enzyme related to lactoylglutathione lyase